MDNFEQKDDEITLRQLIQNLAAWWRFLLGKWIVLLITFSIGASIGLIYAFFKKPVYLATVTFAIEDDKPAGGALSGALGIASSLGLELGTGAGGAFSSSNLIELLKSRRIIQKSLLASYHINDKTSILANDLLSITNLRRKLVSKSKEFENFSFPLNAVPENLSLRQDSILFVLYEKLFDDEILSVYQKDKKVSIINVEINSTNESFSKSFAENIVKNVSDFYIETKSKKARNNVSILQHQADSIRNELNMAITGVAISTDNTYNLNPAFNINRVPSTKKQIDVQANTAILTQLVTNLELAKVTLLKETPLIQIIDKPILPLKKKEVNKVLASIIGGLVGLIFIILVFSIKRLYDFQLL